MLVYKLTVRLGEDPGDHIYYVSSNDLGLWLEELMVDSQIEIIDLEVLSIWHSTEKE